MPAFGNFEITTKGLQKDDKGLQASASHCKPVQKLEISKQNCQSSRFLRFPPDSDAARDHTRPRINVVSFDELRLSKETTIAMQKACIA